MAALSLLIGCEKIDSLLQPDPSGFFTLESTASSIPADGTTRARITLRVDDQTRFDRVATFETTSGTLVGGGSSIDVSLDLDGYATAELQSDVALGSALVSATVDGLTRTVRIDFRRAYPDHISMSLDTSVLRALFGRQVRMTIQLERGSGTVTSGLQLEFAAYTEGGVPIGAFEATTLSSETGAVSGAFTVGDSPYRGDVTIEVSVVNPDSAQRIVARSIIEVTD